MVERRSGNGDRQLRRLVVKCGTNLLTAGTEQLDRDVMAAIAASETRTVRWIVATGGAVIAAMRFLAG